MTFVSLEEALTELSEQNQEQLKRITQGVNESGLLNVKVDIDNGSIQYLDSKNGSLLIEISNALSFK